MDISDFEKIRKLWTEAENFDFHRALLSAWSLSDSVLYENKFFFSSTLWRGNYYVDFRFCSPRIRMIVLLHRYFPDSPFIGDPDDATADIIYESFFYPLLINKVETFSEWLNFESKFMALKPIFSGLSDKEIRTLVKDQLHIDLDKAANFTCQDFILQSTET